MLRVSAVVQSRGSMYDSPVPALHAQSDCSPYDTAARLRAADLGLVGQMVVGLDVATAAGKSAEAAVCAVAQTS